MSSTNKTQFAGMNHHFFSNIQNQNFKQRVAWTKCSMTDFAGQWSRTWPSSFLLTLKFSLRTWCVAFRRLFLQGRLHNAAIPRAGNSLLVQLVCQEFLYRFSFRNSIWLVVVTIGKKRCRSFEIVERLHLDGWPLTEQLTKQTVNGIHGTVASSRGGWSGVTM